MCEHCVLCMCALVVLGALVPMSLVCSFFLCNQSREYSEDGELLPTNAAVAQMALGVDMLSQVSLADRANCVCSLPCWQSLRMHPCARPLRK